MNISEAVKVFEQFKQAEGLKAKTLDDVGFTLRVYAHLDTQTMQDEYAANWKEG